MNESKQIEVKDYADESHIEIYPKIESWQLSALSVWNGLWFFCGVIMTWQLFQPISRDLKLFAFTYLILWAWFLYKGIYFFLWKRYGRERIRIYQEGIQYKKDIKGYGKVKTYQGENISKLSKIQLKQTSYSWSYQQSFWMPGNETVGFEYFGKTIGLGLQLDNQQQHYLLKTLRHRMSQFGKLN